MAKKPSKYVQNARKKLAKRRVKKKAKKLKRQKKRRRRVQKVKDKAKPVTDEIEATREELSKLSDETGVSNLSSGGSSSSGGYLEKVLPDPENVSLDSESLGNPFGEAPSKSGRENSMEEVDMLQLGEAPDAEAETMASIDFGGMGQTRSEGSVDWDDPFGGR